jgi:DNA-binding NtrC family response regulator
MAEKILVVEDESFTRRNIRQFLDDEGYQVKEAAHGGEALEMLQKEDFNLVITDLVMPHVNGIRLVESIHANWPWTSAVLLTAYLSTAAGNMILQGRAEVVTKPLDLGQLLATVKRLLHKQ